MDIQVFNSLSSEEQKRLLMHCCHCPTWVERVLSTGPFESEPNLLDTMEKEWRSASEAEYLEAFAAHPRIGDMEVLRNRFAKQAHKEQGQVAQASDAILTELKCLNDRYFDRFGFIFIICASGKSAAEMCVALSERLNNPREEEISNAAHEQLAIMKLRFAQLDLNTAGNL